MSANLYLANPAESWSNCNFNRINTPTLNSTGSIILGTAASPHVSLVANVPAVDRIYTFRDVGVSGTVDISTHGIFNQTTNISTTVNTTGSSFHIITQTATSGPQLIQFFQVNNPLITVSSNLQITVCNYTGGYPNAGEPDVLINSIAAGSFVVVIFNTAPLAGNPLNGTFDLSIQIQ